MLLLVLVLVLGVEEGDGKGVGAGIFCGGVLMVDWGFGEAKSRYIARVVCEECPGCEVEVLFVDGIWL